MHPPTLLTTRWQHLKCHGRIKEVKVCDWNESVYFHPKALNKDGRWTVTFLSGVLSRRMGVSCSFLEKALSANIIVGSSDPSVASRTILLVYWCYEDEYCILLTLPFILSNQRRSIINIGTVWPNRTQGILPLLDTNATLVNYAGVNILLTT